MKFKHAGPGLISPPYTQPTPLYKRSYKQRLGYHFGPDKYI